MVVLCSESRVFDGFHHDGSERRGIAVVASTSPFFKLSLVLLLTRRLEGKEKVMFTFHPDQTGTQRRCAVFLVDNDDGGGGEFWETGGPRFLGIVCLSDFIFWLCYTS